MATAYGQSLTCSNPKTRSIRRPDPRYENNTSHRQISVNRVNRVRSSQHYRTCPHPRTLLRSVLTLNPTNPDLVDRVPSLTVEQHARLPSTRAYSVATCHTASVPSCRPPRGCPIGARWQPGMRRRRRLAPPHSEAAHNSAV